MSGVTKLCIYPFSQTSEGAKFLKKTIGCPWYWDAEMGRDMAVINWGWGHRGSINRASHIFNKPEAISISCDKRETFKKLKDARVPKPEWSSHAEEALDWLKAGFNVYGRDTEAGCDGAGIRVYHPGERLGHGHLFYTRGFPTDREFRVNCAFGKVIDICEKKRRTGSNPNLELRCGDDWVYCREDLRRYPTDVGVYAAKAIQALGLDFGGVDIGLSADGDVIVFETNTAPWLGSVIAREYANAFFNRIKEL